MPVRTFAPSPFAALLVGAVAGRASPQRAAMLRIVRKNPGISVVDLASRLPYSWASYYHHLGILVEEGKVEVERDPLDGRRRHIYALPRKGSAKEPSGVLSEPLAEVARLVLAHPGADVEFLAQRVSTTKRNVYFHVRKLLELDLITRDSPTRFQGLRPTPRLSALLNRRKK